MSLADLGIDLRPIQRIKNGRESDYITLTTARNGSTDSPGHATILRAGTYRKWDERVGYGIDGSSLVFGGNKLSPVDVQIEIWDPADFFDWEIFALKYLTKTATGLTGKKSVEAIGISHPVLQMPPVKISKVVLVEAPIWKQDEYGLWTTVLKFQEFRAPRPLLARADPGLLANTTAPPKPQNPTEALIQQLEGEVKAEENVGKPR